MSIRFSIITLFPEIFPGPLGVSLIGKSLREKFWELNIIDLKKYVKKNERADDEIYGGGPGMLLRADVIDNALKDNFKKDSAEFYYLSPTGKIFSQEAAKIISKSKREIVFLCGRFEGVDTRVLSHWNFKKISIGDFILSGAESAALVIVESCVRLIPNVLGDKDSLIEESFENELLEYPHYTRPKKWNNYEVPEVLMSGNHKRIKEWRLNQSETITKLNRPDLWSKYQKLKKD